MNIMQFPTSGLTAIDIRVVKVVSTALSCEVEIARNSEDETFALIIPCSGGDLVFTLTKEQSEYVLTKYGYYPEPPHKVVTGSLEAALAALPRTFAV
ncbi:MAG: hypothetical protein O7I42_25855 [Alphaproteobacteria bacterium]|nr:hypothetical protein [Alphaproteobacteria bacterium]